MDETVRQELNPEVATIIAGKHEPFHPRLSELDPFDLLTERQTAPYLKVTVRCLQNWRMTGYGPRFVRLSGSAIRYQVKTLLDWTRSRTRNSTSEPDPEEV